MPWPPLLLFVDDNLENELNRIDGPCKKYPGRDGPEHQLCILGKILDLDSLFYLIGRLASLWQRSTSWTKRWVDLDFVTVIWGVDDAVSDEADEKDKENDTRVGGFGDVEDLTTLVQR